AGNTTSDESSSGTLSQVVNKADTTTALSSSANPSVVGQAVTFTASVTVTAPGTGTPSGAVTFQDGATPLGPARSMALDRPPSAPARQGAGKGKNNAG